MTFFSTIARSTDTPSGNKIRVLEFMATDAKTFGQDGPTKGTWYIPSSETSGLWTKELTSSAPTSDEETSTTVQSRLEALTKDTFSHMLPAQYPQSVTPGYLQFAGYGFVASVAGSAAMVLSTQTLLLAVGVVGSNVQQAGVMAGAFNWVMKDFVGQLGGVLFASQMGKTRAFDTDPKRWRMTAAMALDGATLLEILAPLFSSSMVLPIASIANVGKNIGFLTASASKASIHQSVATTGNLGDVTAKAGSQAIMASLIGTSLGIGISSVLAHDTFNFAVGFGFLGVVHQGCNYLSLQSVPLKYFNRQRLYLVLEEYIATGTVLKPTQISQKESFFPLTTGDPTATWLTIGDSVDQVCSDPTKLEDQVLSFPEQRYWIAPSQTATESTKMDLLFFQNATGEDIIRGLYHACISRDAALNDTQIAKQVEKKYPDLLKQLQESGWDTSTDVTTVERSQAKRIAIEFMK